MSLTRIEKDLTPEQRRLGEEMLSEVRAAIAAREPLMTARTEMAAVNERASKSTALPAAVATAYRELCTDETFIRRVGLISDRILEVLHACRLDDEMSDAIAGVCALSRMLQIHFASAAVECDANTAHLATAVGMEIGGREAAIAHAQVATSEAMAAGVVLGGRRPMGVA